MKNTRRIRYKGIGAIVASVLLPTVIIYFYINSIGFEKFTEKAGVVCAKATFWNAQQNQVQVDDSSSKNSQVQALVQNMEQVASVGSMWSIYNTEEEEEITIPDVDVKIPPQDNTINTALPYPSDIENKSGVIKQASFNNYTGTQFFNLENGQVKNCTSVKNTTLIDESKKHPEFKIEINDEPQVLIMHTHTTESYEPYSRDFYDDKFISRTTDHTKNVVSVGEKIKQEIEACGIGVIHDTTIHDYPSYNGSYQRSAITVEKMLEKYPSIKVVLDVHRDAIQSSDGVRSAPVANINGKQAAQVMIISGCDDGTMDMPNYMQNFRFSAMLQNQLESDYEGITRPVLFDYRKYNQDLTTGSILLEMGAHGNSLDEALYSGELVGKSISQVLLNLQ